MRKEAFLILESWPWKQELLNHANVISETLVNYSSTDIEEEELGAMEFRLERAVFYSAYIIRKLIENGKLTDICSTQKISVSVYKSIATQPSIRKSFGLEMGRNFESFENNKITLQLDSLMSEIIHSFLLVWQRGDSGQLEGMLLSSYKNQTKRALLLKFDQLIEIIRSVGNDDVVKIDSSVDPETGEVVRKNS